MLPMYKKYLKKSTFFHPGKQAVKHTLKYLDNRKKLMYAFGRVVIPITPEWCHINDLRR